MSTQTGLNMAEFCKQFNDQTKNYDKDVPVPVVLSGTSYNVCMSYELNEFMDYFTFITAYSNRSFTFVLKSPPTSWFLKRCADIKKGSARYEGAVRVCGGC